MSVNTPNYWEEEKKKELERVRNDKEVIDLWHSTYMSYYDDLISSGKRPRHSVSSTPLESQRKFYDDLYNCYLDCYNHMFDEKSKQNDSLRNDYIHHLEESLRDSTLKGTNCIIGSSKSTQYTGIFDRFFMKYVDGMLTIDIIDIDHSDEYNYVTIPSLIRANCKKAATAFMKHPHKNPDRNRARQLITNYLLKIQNNRHNAQRRLRVVVANSWNINIDKIKETQFRQINNLKIDGLTHFTISISCDAGSYIELNNSKRVRILVTQSLVDVVSENRRLLLSLSNGTSELRDLNPSYRQ